MSGNAVQRAVSRASYVRRSQVHNTYGFQDCMYAFGHVFCEARPGRHGQCVGHRLRRPMLDDISQARRSSAACTHTRFVSTAHDTDAGGNSNTATPPHWTRAACTTSADLMPHLCITSAAQAHDTHCSHDLTAASASILYVHAPFENGYTLIHHPSHMMCHQQQSLPSSISRAAAGSRKCRPRRGCWPLACWERVSAAIRPSRAFT